jgi:hypothetical protein
VEAEEAVGELFGNIWHQGTVYEATAYAVPFLIEIVDDPKTSGRPLILNLLASIANGSSYHDVHRHIMRDGVDEAQVQRELGWVRAAHEAVAAGFATYRRMSGETNGDIWMTSLYVMAQLPEHAASTVEMIHRRIGESDRALSAYSPIAMLTRKVSKVPGELPRAGLFLLLGSIGDASTTTLNALVDGATGPNPLLRRASAIAISQIRPQPMPPSVFPAIEETLVDDAVEKAFMELPWDASEEIDRRNLIEALDQPSRNSIAERFIVEIERGEGGHTSMSTMLDIVFGHDVAGERSPESFSPLQKRAVRAIASAIKSRRLYLGGTYREWGLPHKAEDLQKLLDSF